MLPSRDVIVGDFMRDRTQRTNPSAAGMGNGMVPGREGLKFTAICDSNEREDEANCMQLTFWLPSYQVGLHPQNLT